MLVPIPLQRTTFVQKNHSYFCIRTCLSLQFTLPSSSLASFRWLLLRASGASLLVFKLEACTPRGFGAMFCFILHAWALSCQDKKDQDISRYNLKNSSTLNLKCLFHIDRSEPSNMMCFFSYFSRAKWKKWLQAGWKRRQSHSALEEIWLTRRVVPWKDEFLTKRIQYSYIFRIPNFSWYGMSSDIDTFYISGIISYYL